MDEIWKSVPEYEEEYEVSNLGRLKSLARKIFDGRTWRNQREKILKGENHPEGYISFNLYKTNSGAKKRVLAHRLVMEVFNGPSKLHVDHLNMDRRDNRLCNLEYVTQSENNKREAIANKKSGLPLYITKQGNKFRTRIGRKSIGSFFTIEEAVKARDACLI